MSSAVQSSRPVLIGAASAAPRQRRPVQLAVVVVWVWLVALLLSLYGAPSIRDWLRTDGEGHEDGWRLMAGDALVKLADATGLSALRRTLEGGSGSEVQRDVGRVALVKPDLRPAPSPPAAAAPGPIRRVLLVGASTIQFHLGTELERRLPERHPGLEVVRLGKLSTGLTRPDVFNWPAILQILLDEHHPDLVVANFGGNDAQAMVLDDGRVARFGRPEWEATYRSRVQHMVQLARRAGAHVVLLGMSTTRDPALSRRMERINTLTEEAGRAVGAAYLSIWDIGADARGKYQDVTVVEGVPIRTRLADGKHFSRVGAAFAADQILQRMAAVVPLPAAAAQGSH